jgi:hypothetical protein
MEYSEQRASKVITQMINPWTVWFDYQIWLMLQMKFMTPAAVMSKGAEMEQFMKQFSLNGIKSSNMCNPCK